MGGKKIMVIGIIGAMDKEINELKSRTEIIKITKKAEMEFFSGKLLDKDVVIVKSGVGKVNAAVCTQILIDYFNVQYVINTGIAGGVKACIKPGDVVISKDLVYHDVDGTAFGDRLGQVPNMNVFNFEADDFLSQLAVKAAKTNNEINVFLGRIISGDQFIADHSKLKFLRDNFDACAVEMEGTAIAHTCYLNKIPFVIIRSISDCADGSAHMDYEKFQSIAIKNSVQILLNMIKEL